MSQPRRQEKCKENFFAIVEASPCLMFVLSCFVVVLHGGITKKKEMQYNTMQCKRLNNKARCNNPLYYNITNINNNNEVILIDIDRLRFGIEKKVGK
tara:strand:- start:163 stop:453 length:291 start_codon:yes stop_codon:yes gene_type:complete